MILKKIKLHFRLLFGGPILLSLIIVAIFSGFIAPYDPLEINADNILKSPSKHNLLGTDALGRDILSRIIYGSRISLSVSGFAVFLSILIGVPLGLATAYLGGHFDNIVMRIIDIFVCLPVIFVAIMVMAFFEQSLKTLILTVGFLYFPHFTKVTNSVASSIKNKDFILAAICLGASGSRIVFREILPNLISIIIVQASFTMSFALLMEAGLSFLGLGVAPPQPSWGQMVGQLKGYIFRNPVPIIFPSIALFLAIFSINMIGDWLQDHLNPEIVR